MGAWGEKGFDNDTAADWLDGITEMFQFTLLRGFWSRWQEEGVAAAQLLSELPPLLQERLGPHVFSEALEVIDLELRPDAVTPWKHPAKRRRYLNALKATLTRRHGLFPKPKRRRARRVRH